MTKLFLSLFLLVALSLNAASEPSEEGVVVFTPPSGWHVGEDQALPVHVRVMVVGKGPSAFPPSMNLSSEPYKGTLSQYLKSVKSINDAQGYEWKDLGSIKTEAGLANLSQVDTKTQWGDVRLMHVILKAQGHIYILTASALKNEFSLFYKEFFASLRSLRIAKDLYEIIGDPQQRNQLRTAAAKLQLQWNLALKKEEQENHEKDSTDLKESLFKSEPFQNEIWKPFQAMLTEKYGIYGSEWQTLFLQKLENQLYNGTFTGSTGG